MAVAKFKTGIDMSVECPKSTRTKEVNSLAWAHDDPLNVNRKALTLVGPCEPLLVKLKAFPAALGRNWDLPYGIKFPDPP